MQSIINFFSDRLERRLILYFMPLIVLPVAASLLLLSQRWSASIQSNIDTLEEEHISNEAVELNTFLNFIDDDLRFLSTSSDVQALADSLVTGDAEALEEERINVQNDLVSLVFSSQFYYKLRILDATGQEIVRVDYVNGEAVVFTGSELQDKSDRPYYIDGIGLAEGQLYISPLDLNREGTPPTIEGTLVDGTAIPVIRYSLPIFATNPQTGASEVAGLIVTSINANALFQFIDTSGDDGISYLLNPDGYYLFNTADPLSTFGFEEDIEEVGGLAGASIFTDYSTEDATQLQTDPANLAEAHEGEEGLFDVGEFTTSNDFFVHTTRIRPPGASADYYWTLVSLRDRNVVFGEVQQIQTATTIALALLVVVGAGATVFVARRIAEPIQQLSDRAQGMAGGDFSQASVIQTNRRDEIGNLGHSFNTMATQLQDLIANMENRINARTADLQTSADISAAANQIREQSDLLSLAVNLLRDRFNFYYVQIYLVNQERTYAVLREGTGYVGRRLLVRGHKLPLDGQSLVARTIHSGAYNVVQDTSQDPDFLPNDLLPDTKAELTVPLKTQDQVIGVIDIQHNEPNAFDDDSRNLFLSLAEQLAVTFENVRLFEETERRAREMETVAEVSAAAATNLDVYELLRDVSTLARDSFNLYHAHMYLLDESGRSLNLTAGAGEIGFALVQEGHSIPFNSPVSLVARAARERDAVIVNDVTANPDFLANPLLPNTKSEMAIPLVVGDELVGVMDVQADEIDRFGNEDAQIFATLSSQIAVAVQNARAFQQVEVARTETERQNERVNLLNELALELGTVTVTEDMFKVVARYTNEIIHSVRTSIGLVNSDGSGIELLGIDGEKGSIPTGITLPIDKSFIGRVYSSGEFSVGFDLEQYEGMVDIAQLHKNGIQSVMSAPLTLQGQVIGTLNVGSPQPHAYARTDENLIRQVASLLSSTMENRNLFEQANLAREESNLLFEVTTAINQSRTVDDLINAVTDHNLPDAFSSISINVYDTGDIETASVVQIVGHWGRDGISAKGMEIPLEIFGAAPNAAPKEVSALSNIPENVTLSEEARQAYANMGVVSFFNAPLDSDGRILGSFSITADQPHIFTDRDVRINQSIAEQISVAFQRMNLVEQTQRRATEMEVVAEVSAEATRSLDTEHLLYTVSDLTKDRFNLYHAHIYLLDETGNFLVLSAGSGDVGRLMASQGHRIPVSREASVVATAAREKRGVVVNDVTDTPNYLPNPMLPETKSEMAIPILGTNNQILGVLDVQDSNVGRFDDEDLRVKTTLAEQIATALQNARSFEQAQYERLKSEQLFMGGAMVNQARTIDSVLHALLDSLDLDEVERANFMLYNKPWNNIEPKYATVEAVWNTDDNERAPVGTQYLVAEFPIVQLVKPGQPLIIRDGQSDELIDDNLKQLLEFLGMRSVVFYPLIAGGDYIGLFTIQSSDVMPLTEDKIRQVYALADQAANVIQSRRLFTQAQKRASELEAVANVSTATTTILDVDVLLESVVELTLESFNLYHAHIYLLDDEKRNLVLMAGAGEAGRLMKENGHAIPLANTNSVVVQSVMTAKGVIVNDVTSAEAFLPNPLLPDTKSEMAIPMVVGNDIIGVLDVQGDTANRFTDEDIRIKTTLAEQIAVAIQNARYFSEAQEQAERERETAERLREVDRLKSQFLANMSHELRTPLNSIIGYSEVLLDGVDGELTEDAEEDVEAIHNSGKHLLSIINEILDLAKIEAGEMQLDIRDVDLVDFAGEIVRNAQVLVKDKPVEVRLKHDDNIPTIGADPIRLRQILWNLVSNAVKFTEEGDVTVNLHCDDDMIHVGIIDSGVGMTEEGLGLIFERFSQVDGSSTRRAGGTGLGLTITRQLIQMHGGDIKVESELGIGSTFTFTLPIKVAEGETEKA